MTSGHRLCEDGHSRVQSLARGHGAHGQGSRVGSAARGRAPDPASQVLPSEGDGTQRV